MQLGGPNWYSPPPVLLCAHPLPLDPFQNRVADLVYSGQTEVIAANKTFKVVTLAPGFIFSISPPYYRLKIDNPPGCWSLITPSVYPSPQRDGLAHICLPCVFTVTVRNRRPASVSTLMCGVPFLRKHQPSLSWNCLPKNPTKLVNGKWLLSVRNK